MSRLTIDITDHQHRSLKASAALQGKAIRQYALERLLPTPSNGDQTWDELKSLLEQRIGDGLAGKVSTKSVNAILDEGLVADGGVGI